MVSFSGLQCLRSIPWSLYEGDFRNKDRIDFCLFLWDTYIHKNERAPVYMPSANYEANLLALWSLWMKKNNDRGPSERLMPQVKKYAKSGHSGKFLSTFLDNNKI